MIRKTHFADVEDLKYYGNKDWGKTLWNKTFVFLHKALKDKVWAYK